MILLTDKKSLESVNFTIVCVCVCVKGVVNSVLMMSGWVTSVSPLNGLSGY